MLWNGSSTRSTSSRRFSKPFPIWTVSCQSLASLIAFSSDCATWDCTQADRGLLRCSSSRCTMATASSGASVHTASDNGTQLSGGDSVNAIVICLGSMRGTSVKLLTSIVRGWSGITSMSPLAHRTNCLYAAPSCCVMSRKLHGRYVLSLAPRTSKQ